MAYLKVDGKFGKTTKTRFQQYMKHYGWYPRTVDGSFGPQSWKGVQRMLQYFGYYKGYNIDGSPGTQTWRSLNDFLWIEFKGYTPIGPYYMSKRNSGVYTYSWSSQLVKALQHGLNVHYS